MDYVIYKSYELIPQWYTLAERVEIIYLKKWLMPFSNFENVFPEGIYYSEKEVKKIRRKFFYEKK